MKKVFSCTAIVLLFLLSSLASSFPQTLEEDYHVTTVHAAQYENGFRYNVQGWIYLHIEGDPYERGYQHGYLLSAEIVDMLHRWSNIIHNYKFLSRISPHLSEERYQEISEIWWNFCVSFSTKLYGDKFPEEYQEEMQGIADGATDAGGQIHGHDITYEDILTLNEMYEFLSKCERWYLNKVHPFRTLLQQLQSVTPELSTLDESTILMDFLLQPRTHHCNGFVATGDATTDGQIVISDSMLCGPGSWWWTYYISKRWNVILDVQPTEGHRVLMASSPGFIWSDHDFYQNDVGLSMIETTVPQGLFDNIGLPLSVRARTAMQYGDSIDDMAYYLRYRNDGGMNAVWLMADAKTNEIARFELGYRRYYVNRTFNGFYWSANNPENTGVRLEKVDIRQIISKFILHILVDYPGFGYHSIFYRPEARDIKYEELGNQYYGEIDVDVVKTIMATSPISDWNTDCKITDSSLLEQNGAWFFYGNNDGRIENLTNFDYPERTIEQIHPTGWVRIYGLPEKENYTFQRDRKAFGDETEPLWTYDTGSDRNDFSCSSVIENDTLYTCTSFGQLFALSTDDGTLQWSAPIGEHPTTPVVCDNMVIVGSDDGLTAFDLEGNEERNIPFSDTITSISVTEDGVVLAGDETGMMYAIAVNNSEELWNISFSDEIHLSEVVDDTIYVASGDSCSAVNVTTSDVIWINNADGMITSSPLFDEGIVYIGSHDTLLYALNATNGDVLWTYETGWGIDASPAVFDDTVFVGSTDGNCYALHTTNGSLQWMFSCNSAIHTSPAVTNGRMLFGSDDGRWYCLNTTTGNATWMFAPNFTTDDDIFNYITTALISSIVIDENVAFTGANGFIYAFDTEAN